jgi:hypothetical protein
MALEEVLPPGRMASKVNRIDSMDRKYFLITGNK